VANITRIVNDNYPIVGNIYITKTGANSRQLQDLTGYAVNLHLMIKDELTVIGGSLITSEDIILDGAVSSIVDKASMDANSAVLPTRLKVKDMPFSGIGNSGSFTVGAQTYGYIGVDTKTSEFLLDGVNTDVTELTDGASGSVAGLGGKVSFPLEAKHVNASGSYKYSIKLVKNGVTTTYGRGNFIVELDLQ